MPAPVRRAETHFQGQLLYLGGKSCPGESWDLHAPPWSEVEEWTASFPAEKLLAVSRSRAACSVFCLLWCKKTFSSDTPRRGPKQELQVLLGTGGWRLNLPCSFQLRCCPPNTVFFQLAGTSVQPEGAVLSLGNCTSQITTSFLWCQLP